jgi:catechol 2,3-dioxygenase-like lactoylglutathione lyase family enzyme
MGSHKMIGYVTIGTDDFDSALPFYDAVLGAIGYDRKSFSGAASFYGPADSEGMSGSANLSTASRRGAATGS